MTAVAGHTGNRRLLIGGNQFLIGYQPQREWAWLIATAFFLGKLGGGVFLVSYLGGFKLGALVGLAIVAIGKTTAHLLFLGRPERFLRAIVGWRTSWISRGLLAMGAFIVCALVYLASYLHASFVPAGVARGFGVAAAVAAVVVMFYDGFVLKASRGIRFWDTYLMPVLMFFYALLGGVVGTLALETLAGEATRARLEWTEVGLLVANLALVGVYVLSARVRGAASELAARLLTRDRTGWTFLLALAVGIGLSLVLAVVAVGAGSGGVTLALAALTDLLGHFFVFFAILRVGLHAPIRPLPLYGVRGGASA
jgi:formate-dependent nitrite reductase membrane component NrfD